MNYFDSQLKNLSSKKMNFVKPTVFNKVEETTINPVSKQLRPGMKIRLALSGSGFLLPAHAGAICALLDKNIQIVEVAGTSGGAIIACSVATMWNQDDLLRTALEDLPSGILSYQPSAILKQGFNNGLIFKKFLDQKLGDLFFINVSIPLKIVATDINNGCPYILSQETTPYIKLSDACRASASIPLYFSPYYINEVKLSDGCLVNNFPINLLTDDEIIKVGICVTNVSLKSDTNTLFCLLQQYLNVITYDGQELLKTESTKLGVTVIDIDVTDYPSSLDTDLTKDQKYDLFMRGYNKVLTMF